MPAASQWRRRRHRREPPHPPTLTSTSKQNALPQVSLFDTAKTTGPGTPRITAPAAIFFSSSRLQPASRKKGMHHHQTPIAPGFCSRRRSPPAGSFYPGLGQMRPAELAARGRSVAGGCHQTAPLSSEVARVAPPGAFFWGLTPLAGAVP